MQIFALALQRYKNNVEQYIPITRNSVDKNKRADFVPSEANPDVNVSGEPGYVCRSHVFICRIRNKIKHPNAFLFIYFILFILFYFILITAIMPCEHLGYKN